MNAAAINIDAENPYINGFEEETLNAVPANWSTLGTGDVYVESKADADPKPHGGSSRALYIRVSKGDTCVLVLPEFSDDINNLILSFFPCKSKGSKGKAAYALGFVKDDEFTKIGEDFEVPTAYASEAIELAFEGKATAGARIAIRVVNTETSGSNKTSLYIDDVKVASTTAGTPITCAAPTELKLDGEAAIDSADFVWTAGGEETAWEYSIDAEKTWKAVEGTEAKLTVKGLKANTAYELFVRAACSDEDKSKSAKVEFKTAAVVAPTKLAAKEAGKNDVTLEWTAAEGIADYEAVVAVKGQEADWSKATLVKAATTVKIEGLKANTVYNAFVRSHVSDDAVSEAISVEFRTDCDVVAALPFAENFNGDDALVCWEIKGANGENEPTIKAGSNMFLSLESNALVFSGKNDHELAYAFLPEISADLSKAQITFSLVGEEENKGYVNFGYFDDKGNFLTLQDYIPTKKMTAVEPLELDDVPANARLAFSFKVNSTDAYAYVFAIDDIVIEEAPACAVPTGIKIFDLVYNSVSFTLHTEATGIQYEIREQGVEWGDDDNTKGVAYGDIEHEGGVKGIFVVENTTYELRVKAICSEDSESAWSTPIEFTVPCGVREFGYTEDFKEGMPDCWANEDVHGPNSWTANNEALRYTATENNFNHAYLATPWIAVANEGTPVVHFNLHNTGVKAVLLIEAEGEKADTLLDLNVVSEDTIAKAYLADFKGKNVRFHFNAESGAKSKFITIDNFSVVEKPFFAPTKLVATPIAKGAELSWFAGWDEAAWNVQYKKSADEEWTLVANLDATSYTLTGLEPEVEYEVQVRAIYGEGKESAWTEPAILFTPEAEPETAIENALVSEKAVKMVVNGQLIIIRDGVQYNAQGVRVSE